MSYDNLTRLLNSLDCECDEYHGVTCGLCLARVEWRDVQAELARLSAPRPAPRCPECGSEATEVQYYSEDDFYLVYCLECVTEGEYHRTIDAALDAWRPKP